MFENKLYVCVLLFNGYLLLEKNQMVLHNSHAINSHPLHKAMIHQALKGGVKDGTEKTYMKNYGHFIKTILLMGHNPFEIPVETDLILLYLANGLLQKNPNCDITVRGKLRAIDWINQQFGIQTIWHHDGFIKPIYKHIKKNFPGKGSNLVPIYLRDIISLIKFIETQHNDHNIYNGIERFEWFLFKIHCIISYTAALRISECVHPQCKSKHDYGIRFCDFLFGFKINDNKIQFLPYDFKLRKFLFCIKIILQNSKTQLKNVTDYVFIGPTSNAASYNPCLMIFDCFYLYQNMAQKHPNAFKFNPKSTLHFFQRKKGYFNPSWCTTKIHFCFKSMGYENWEQFNN